MSWRSTQFRFPSVSRHHNIISFDSENTRENFRLNPGCFPAYNNRFVLFGFFLNKELGIQVI